MLIRPKVDFTTLIKAITPMTRDHAKDEQAHFTITTSHCSIAFYHTQVQHIQVYSSLQGSNETRLW